MACSTPACARNAKLMEIPNNKWGEDPGPAEQNIDQDRGWLQRQECDSLQSLWSRSDWSCFIKVVGRWFEIFFCMIVRFWWCHQIPAHYLTSLALGYNKRTTFHPSNPENNIYLQPWSLDNHLSSNVLVGAAQHGGGVSVLTTVSPCDNCLQLLTANSSNYNPRSSSCQHKYFQNSPLLTSCQQQQVPALLVKFDRFSVAPAKYWYNTVLFVLQQEQVRWYPIILSRVTISQRLQK